MISTSPAQQAHRVLLGLFFVLLAWVPLPMASNRPWAVALLAVLSWGLVTLALALHAWAGTGERVWPALRRARLPLAVLTAYTGLVIWQRWGGGYTADPFETRQYLLRCLGYLGCFLLVLLLADNDRRRLGLMGALVASGLLQALLAIGLLSAQARYDFVGVTVHHTTRALGTFHSADALANYLLLTLSAGLGLMLAGLGGPRTQRPPGWRGTLLAAAEFSLSTKMLVRLTLVILVIVLVLTRSRMGNGAFFIALFLMAAWVMWVSPRLRRPAGWLVASLLVVDLVVIGQWVGLEKVVRRLERTDVVAEQAASAAASAASGAAVVLQPTPPGQHHREETLAERIRPAVDAWRLVEQRPALGWGGGSFATVFPTVKRAELTLRVDHAHNDYVEILVDTGAAGLALLGALWVASLWCALRLVRDDVSPLQRGLAIGGAMALVCALLHATVDFHLQLPANAVTLTVLLAATWGLPQAGEHGGRRRRRGAHRIEEDTSHDSAAQP